MIFLSPYTDIDKSHDKVILHSKLTDSYAILNTDNFEKLINFLEQGITYEDLIKFLTDTIGESNPKSWIANLFLIKILE